MSNTSIYRVHSYPNNDVLKIHASSIGPVCSMFAGLGCSTTVNTGPGIVTHNISHVCIHLCSTKAYGVLVFNPNTNTYYPYGQPNFLNAVEQAIDLGLAVHDAIA